LALASAGGIVKRSTSFVSAAVLYNDSFRAM
jgi:hypothetical protein